MPFAITKSSFFEEIGATPTLFRPITVANTHYNRDFSHQLMQVVSSTEVLMSDTPKTTAQIEETVREALRQVVDPEIGMDVITLGLIRDIQVEEDSVHIIMILTTPFCPYGPQIMEQVRRTAGEASGLKSTIEMGLEIWDPSMMEEGAMDDWGLF